MVNIVVFSGAGISAESGLKTFRDNDGLWHNYRIEDVATPQAFEANPQLVLDFYNHRQKEALAAEPNNAHYAIASLEEKHNVTIVTQNVDGLHEKSGSKNVIHLHGKLDWAQSINNPEHVLPLHGKPIELGNTCPNGFQLRPHIVWFGEQVINVEPALDAISKADKLLVVGTSLSVYPAAGFIEYAPTQCEKHLIALDIDEVPNGFNFIQGKASECVPKLIEPW